MAFRINSQLLRSDPALWTAVGLFVAVVTPYFVPLLTPDQLFDWGWVYGDVPISVATVIALGWGLWRLPEGAERHLWQWVLVAFSLGLLAEIVNAYLPIVFTTTASDLAIDVVYLLYYLALLLAPVAALPGPKHRQGWSLHLLRHAALGLAAVGFLVYAQTIPYHANPDVLGWYPGLFLYALLDLAVAVVFFRARAQQSDARLRAVLATVAIVSLGYAIFDTFEAVLWLEPYQLVELSPWWDVAWWVPELTLVIGARLFLSNPREGTVSGTAWYPERRDRGTLVLGLCALPFAHALLSFTGTVDPELRDSRDALTAFYLALVGLFAWLYFRVLAAREAQARADAERLGEELLQARKLESLGTLAGGIAHDFNNLLQPIMGFTEMAKERVSTHPLEAQEDLDRVLEASERAAELVDQVLAVSRTHPRTSVPVQLEEVVTDALRLLRSGLHPSITIAWEPPRDLPSVLGDPARLHQVVMNLCTNAAQAIGASGGEITVSLEVEQLEPPADSHTDGSGWVVLTIHDTGVGISPTTAERAFDPFFTTKPVGEGTGLGLSVVHGIVLSHGGTVDLSGEPTGGATARVRLPTGVGPKEATTSPPTSIGRPLSVLLVDDDAAVATITKRMLESEGHRVEAFEDPLLALERFRESPHTFDVAVTDSWMPAMSGKALAEELRRRQPELGIVVSSGFHPSQPDPHGYVRLRKPFGRNELRVAVSRAVPGDDPGLDPP